MCFGRFTEGHKENVTERPGLDRGMVDRGMVDRGMVDSRTPQITRGRILNHETGEKREAGTRGGHR